MGVSRYDRDPWLRRRQQLFDDLQARCRQAYLPPTIAELRAAGIERGEPVCRNYDCLRHGPVISFANLPQYLTVWGLRNRRRFICGKCGTRRADLVLIWEG